MAYYIAFLLFTTISYGFYPRDWDRGQSLTNEQRVKFAEGCSWYGTAPFCPAGNSCPSNLERLACADSGQYSTFGNPCWMGHKSYCCPNAAGFTKQRESRECGNNANEVKLGNFDSVDACADACRARPTCRYFIYGKYGKAGECWDEGITESQCTNWVVAQYDFYRVLESKSKLKSVCEDDASSDVESGVGAVSENERLKATNKELQDALRAVLAN